MKKRLLFYIWAYKDVRKNPIYKLHLLCLKEYVHNFTDVVFFIAMDDINDDELYTTILYDILQCGFDNVSFKFVRLQNNVFEREGKTCHDELFSKLSEYDGLTMFAHTKGLSNVMEDNVLIEDKDKIRRISMWVCGMYYSLLSDISDVERRLKREGYLAYGAFKVTGRYLCYSGAFYWVNDRSVYNFLKKKHIEVPLFSNRIYAEDIWFQIITNDEAETTMQTFCNRHLENFDNIEFYNNTEYIIKLLWGDNVFNNFLAFFNKKFDELCVD